MKKVCQQCRKEFELEEGKIPLHKRLISIREENTYENRVHVGLKSISEKICEGSGMVFVNNDCLTNIDNPAIL